MCSTAGAEYRVISKYSSLPLAAHIRCVVFPLRVQRESLLHGECESCELFERCYFVAKNMKRDHSLDADDHVGEVPHQPAGLQEQTHTHTQYTG